MWARTDTAVRGFRLEGCSVTSGIVVPRMTGGSVETRRIWAGAKIKSTVNFGPTSVQFKRLVAPHFPRKRHQMRYLCDYACFLAKQAQIQSKSLLRLRLAVSSSS